MPLLKFLAPLLAVFYLLAGCNGATSTDKEISLYTMQLKPMFTDYMEGVIKGFEEANPGVKVKWLDYPAQNYDTKLQSLIVSNNAPDVMNLPYDLTVDLFQRDQLMVLNDRISSEVLSGYLDSVIEDGCTFNGKLVALPWYQATAVMMYNGDIFQQAGLDPEKPPGTRQELYDMSRQIKEKTGIFGFAGNFSESGQLKTELAQAGVPLVNEDKTKATFNTPRAVSLLNELKSLFEEGVIPRESITAEHRRAIDLFKSGKTAVLRSGPQFLFIVKNEAPDIYNKIRVAHDIPIEGTNNYDLATQNLSIYKNTPNAKEAIDLALWLTNAENQLAFSKKVTIFPSVTKALEDPYFTKPGDAPEDKARAIGAEQIKSAKVVVPVLPRVSELNKVMTDVMNQVLLNNREPQEVLAEAEQKWTQILSKK